MKEKGWSKRVSNKYLVGFSSVTRMSMIPYVLNDCLESSPHQVSGGRFPVNSGHQQNRSLAQ